jgi:hypothetical protein
MSPPFIIWSAEYYNRSNMLNLTNYIWFEYKNIPAY